jgi:hypothetical protein
MATAQVIPDGITRKYEGGIVSSLSKLYAHTLYRAKCERLDEKLGKLP